MMHEAPQPTPQIAAAWRELESEMKMLDYMLLVVKYEQLEARARTQVAAMTTALADLDAVIALVGDTDPMAAVMLRGAQQRLRGAMEGTSDE